MKQVICDNNEKCDLYACEHHLAHEQFHACTSESTCFRYDNMPVKCVPYKPVIASKPKKKGR